jgi:hypothetical protein
VNCDSLPRLSSARLSWKLRHMATNKSPLDCVLNFLPFFSCSGLLASFFFDPFSSISFAISTTQRPIYYYIPLSSSSLSFKPGHMALQKRWRAARAKSIHQIGLTAVSSPPRSLPRPRLCVWIYLKKCPDSMCYDFITMIVKLNSLSP